MREDSLVLLVVAIVSWPVVVVIMPCDPAPTYVAWLLVVAMNFVSYRAGRWLQRKRDVPVQQNHTTATTPENTPSQKPSTDESPDEQKQSGLPPTKPD